MLYIHEVNAIKVVTLAVILLFSAEMLFAQQTEPENDMSRGSIPEELLRPQRGESPRYPIDTVIGELGQGAASNEAYRFAREVAGALLAGNIDAPSLSAMNRVVLESYLSALASISPRSYRLGGGREEPDNSFSFLIRFIGREQGITGELFVRFEERRPASPPAPPAPPPVADGETAEGIPGEVPETAPPEPPPPPPPPAKPIWFFDELILEEAKTRETENEENKNRFDFPPYQRFF